jgi:hypothetical protein
MSRIYRFEPNLAFRQLDLMKPDGGTEFELPTDLIDDVQLLEALLIIARAGGTARLARAPDWHDVLVDVATGQMSFERQEI